MQKKYKIQVKDIAVDWYASKNDWMTWETHHKIMIKFNNEMILLGVMYCMFVTMHEATRSESTPTLNS